VHSGVLFACPAETVVPNEPHPLYVLPPGAAAWHAAGELSSGDWHVTANSEGVFFVGAGVGGTGLIVVQRATWKEGGAALEPFGFAGDAGQPSGIPVAVAASEAQLFVLLRQPEHRRALWMFDLTTRVWKEASIPAAPLLPVDDTVFMAFNDGMLLLIDSGLNMRAPGRVYRYTKDGGFALLDSATHGCASAARLGAHHVAMAGLDNGLRVSSYHTLTDRIALYEHHAIGEVERDARVVLASDVTTLYAFVNNRVFRGTFSRGKAGALGAVDWAAIAGYLGVLVVMGWYFSRRESSTEQYFLGGRKIPWWAVGLSIFGTSLSAITYLSIPARAFATNWVYFNANMAIFLVAPIVTIFYLRHYRRWPITTAYEYLEKRFNLLMRIYGSLCFMIFQVGRVGIVMLLPAIALSAATGIDRFTCILVMGLLATVYTVMGGIEAVIWTDVIQAIVLTAGAVLALVLIVVNVEGGPGELIAEAAAAGKFHMVDWGWDPAMTVLWVVLVGNAFANLYPMTADQTVVQRYLSTADEKQAARAVWTNAILTIPITFLFFGLGTALWVYFRHHPAALDPTLKNDAMLPLFVTLEFPMGLRGVLIAGIFAAAMSSLDSSINSVASVLVNDYYRRYIRGVTERQAFIAARVLTLAFGVVGTAAALYAARIEDVSLWDPFLKLLNYVGGGLAGIFALGVFTKRGNGIGAIAGAIAAAIAVYWAQTTPMHFFLHGMVGFLAALGVGYAVSLLTPGQGLREGGPEGD
jgi:solute:Na+ symporter, SSS family